MFIFERLAEWQQSGRQVTMVAVAATSSGFRRRCVCWPHFTQQKPPSPALILVAKPKFIGPPPNVYPKYLLPLPLDEFIQLCSWLLSCIHTRPRCIDCKQQGVVAWGGILTGGVARNNTKQHIARGDIWTHSGCCFPLERFLFLCGGGLG